ncbi:MAG: hypothetical protein COV74_01905 [Candidatus Omnitrophica bacterium CG11_big_fil_rev_8_21_14_0_20_45_26]|uniref:Glycosyltransferase family 1 protein n=1 Tax=Candidatus Abzuiibacterium crystallinum TaxID=1974748 RepID=A0A2H0LSA4_9BACT|nr:MAG: hypothetical protein COV74_01905 [Candidatus Omnitrophica bacterium CG11_big_fil_rev_8_21_14_0_20_45_26]PIW65051.1 MAG: hypothetical protein COW12_04185 [Candidatus Omnitrophica bacterium CG12_big_fil_rev_8_21_14_0_65_45_16]
MSQIKILHLTTHINIGGITTYIYLLGKNIDHSKYGIICASSGGNLKEILERSGIRTIDMDFKTKSELSPKIYLAIPKLLKLIKKENIALIHAHTRITQVMAWWLSCFSGIPVVSTCHGFYKKRLGRRLLPAWGDKIVAISQPVANHLIEYFNVKKEKVHMVLNAIDVSDLRKRLTCHDPNQIRKEWNLASSVPTLGIVARIVQDKGHEYLVRAVKEVKKHYPDIKLVIVGTGPNKKKVLRLIRQLQLEENVNCVGDLTDVTKALAVIDIFILPAIWREGFGLSIVEAMALKKPVIVTNIWALNALVRNLDNGLLIEPKSVKALSEAILALIRDPQLRIAIGTHASETVEEAFAINRLVTEISRIYELAISDKTKLKTKAAGFLI